AREQAVQGPLRAAAEVAPHAPPKHVPQRAGASATQRPPGCLPHGAVRLLRPPPLPGLGLLRLRPLLQRGRGAGRGPGAREGERPGADHARQVPVARRAGQRQGRARRGRREGPGVV
ncbi:unnamed protein product, partial [Prorocentrum cordatum]